MLLCFEVKDDAKLAKKRIFARLNGTTFAI
jgi:hypothetical protein